MSDRVDRFAFVPIEIHSVRSLSHSLTPIPLLSHSHFQTMRVTPLLVILLALPAVCLAQKWTVSSYTETIVSVHSRGRGAEPRHSSMQRAQWQQSGQ